MNSTRYQSIRFGTVAELIISETDEDLSVVELILDQGVHLLNLEALIKSKSKYSKQK